jgi:hypothetical protein
MGVGSVPLRPADVPGGSEAETISERQVMQRVTPGMRSMV